jgi:hypothetical protein
MPINQRFDFMSVYLEQLCAILLVYFQGQHIACIIMHACMPSFAQLQHA